MEPALFRLCLFWGITMSRWPAIAAAVSFIAIAGWLALARFVDEWVPASGLALFYARTFGAALPALVAAAILALFYRAKWPAVVVGSMWTIFFFMLIGQHAGRMAAYGENADKQLEAATAPHAAQPIVVDPFNLTSTESQMWSTDAAGYLKVYCAWHDQYRNAGAGRRQSVANAWV
jgi:hypothetical protein